ncbi:MAG: PEP-CTERM sorting domain-containing protein [Phenylobacterium sp.]
MRQHWTAIAVAGGLGLSLLAAGAANATVTLKFSGDCTDCTGAGGTLTLQNMPSGAISKADFVSFVYQSSLVSFQIRSSDVVAVLGSIDPNNLSTSYIDIIQAGGTGWEFDKNADGTWSVSSDITMGNPHPRGGAGGSGGGGGGFAPALGGDGSDGAPGGNPPPSGEGVDFFTGAGDTSFVDDFGGNGNFDLQQPGGVPEASTWALMLAGFAGMGAMLRRRRGAVAGIETA